jgi:serine/threonine protein kinase
MGEVFEAENLFTSKHVALKWLHQTLSSDPISAQRLVREAQAVGRIRHPNVVDVYDIGRQKDAIFLVMELLVGETLEQRLTRGRLPLHTLLELILPAMRGVAAGHRQGVIHRDLKPENIFLAYVEDQLKPVPKVLDFGISKLIGGEELSLTLPGFAVGTPLYMSSEQVKGEDDIDERADIYAFGVILYEALTGELPFTDDSLVELARKIACEEPKPVSHFRDDLPSSLSILIARAMAKDRAQRPQSLNDLIRDLEMLGSNRVHDYAAKVARAALPRADAEPPPAPVTVFTGDWRRTALWLVSWVAIVIASTVAWQPLQRAWRDRTSIRATAAAPSSSPSKIGAKATTRSKASLPVLAKAPLQSLGEMPRASEPSASQLVTPRTTKTKRIKPKVRKLSEGQMLQAAPIETAPIPVQPEVAADSQPLEPADLPPLVAPTPSHATPASAAERRQREIEPGDSLLAPVGNELRSK